MNLWERLSNWFRGLIGGDMPSRVDAAAESIPRPARKYLIDMLNSITLSSDMNTLYLIDNGRAVSFDLDGPNGVVIGRLGGQLAVVTGAERFDVLDNVVSDGESRSRLSNISKKYPVNSDTQWTLTFNADNGIMAIIGVTDIGGGITGSTSSGCDQDIYQVSDGPIRLARRGSLLVISQANALSTSTLD